jgi:hypothetical protein
MDAPATLVWMAPEPPDAEQSRALWSWARAHGVRLAPPRPGAAPALAVDARIADGVETMLERARDAIAAREGDGADGALSSAESMLRAHPELPQAAWLMAEVERARATRWRRVAPADAEAAEGAWLRAEALDGGRVAAVGEEGSTKHPAPVTIALELSPGDAQAWLDGKPVQGVTVATRTGAHALVVTSAGAPVWAEWIETRKDSSTFHVSAPSAPACSSDDVARAHLTREAFDAPHVRCAGWVAAAAGVGPGSVRVATCEADRCGPVSEWRAPAPWTWSPPAERSHGGPDWPAWATWTLVGTGSAIAAGVLIVASGALQSAPTETRFVSGGIKSK